VKKQMTMRLAKSIIPKTSDFDNYLFDSVLHFCPVRVMMQAESLRRVGYSLLAHQQRNENWTQGESQRIWKTDSRIGAGFSVNPFREAIR